MPPIIVVLPPSPSDFPLFKVNGGEIDHFSDYWRCQGNTVAVFLTLAQIWLKKNSYSVCQLLAQIESCVVLQIEFCWMLLYIYISNVCEGKNKILKLEFWRLNRNSWFKKNHTFVNDLVSTKVQNFRIRFWFYQNLTTFYVTTKQIYDESVSTKSPTVGLLSVHRSALSLDAITMEYVITVR